MAQTEQTKSTPRTKPENGTAAATPAATPPAAPIDPTGAPTAETTGETPTAEKDKAEKARGVIPHMPICAIWKDAAGLVTAAIVHPRGGDYRVTGRGLGGTTGSLADDGYPIGAIRIDGPKWIEGRIPPDVTVLGFAPIQGFPLPKQH